MENSEFKIFIVDDDESVSRGFSLLLRSQGYLTECYPSAERFLAAEDYQGKGCILLDIFMQGRSGLDLQGEITDKYGNLPVIFITGQGDVQLSVKAMRRGALNFLQKPVESEDLFAAVREACLISNFRYNENREIRRLTDLYNSLTPKQSQVYHYLIRGMLNKQIAGELNITEHTVKLHRGQITRKFGVKSLAELVHISGKLKIP
jgi:FixJ family two-component response regulator